MDDSTLVTRLISLIDEDLDGVDTILLKFSGKTEVLGRVYKVRKLTRVSDNLWRCDFAVSRLSTEGIYFQGRSCFAPEDTDLESIVRAILAYDYNYYMIDKLDITME